MSICEHCKGNPMVNTHASWCDIVNDNVMYIVLGTEEEEGDVNTALPLGVFEQYEDAVKALEKEREFQQKYVNGVHGLIKLTNVHIRKIYLNSTNQSMIPGGPRW